MTSALLDKEEREMLLHRSFEEAERFQIGRGLGIACRRTVQAEKQPAVFREVRGQGSKALSCKVF